MKMTALWALAVLWGLVADGFSLLSVDSPVFGSSALICFVRSLCSSSVLFADC